MARTKDYDPERDGPKGLVRELRILPYFGELEPTPSLPDQNPYDQKLETGIKVATPDIRIGEKVSDIVEIVAPLKPMIFESLGAQESLRFVRNDTISGANVSYSPISNLGQIALAYSPTNMLNVPGTLSQYFKNFAIRLDTHFPETGTGPNGKSLYIDRANPDPIQKNRLVIDVVGMKTNEQVEVEILNSGSYLNDIIESTEES